MAPTIKDIALEAGFFIATVSRAMAGEKGITPVTRKRILAIAGQLNYYPNLRARGLVAKKSDVIGIIIARTSEYAFSNPFYIEVLKGIGKKVRESGQYLLLSLSEEENYGLRIQEVWKMKAPMVLIPGDLKGKNYQRRRWQ